MGVNIGAIRSWTQTGRFDMGAIENRYTNVGRFGLSVPRFTLVYFRAIVGADNDDETAPTGTADLEVRIDHAGRLSDIGGDGAAATPNELIPHSYLLAKVAGFGVGNADVLHKFTDEEMQAGAMFNGDFAVFQWTNPETDGSLRWHLDVGLAELL